MIFISLSSVDNNVETYCLLRNFENGGEVGGSWTHLLVHPTGPPSQSSEEEHSEQPMEFQLIWSLEAKDCRGCLITSCKDIL